MAIFVITSATTLYGTAWTGTAPGPGNPTVSGTISSTTDFSDHIKAVNINLTAATQDVTTFGSGGFVSNIPGLVGADLSIDFYGDFAASSVDAVFGPALVNRTLVYLDVKPTSSARAATNPSYVFACYVQSYPPVVNTVGDAAMASVQFMMAGKYARLTS